VKEGTVLVQLDQAPYRAAWCGWCPCRPGRATAR
jgi:hypothetical protein